MIIYIITLKLIYRLIRKQIMGTLSISFYQYSNIELIKMPENYNSVLVYCVFNILWVSTRFLVYQLSNIELK